MDSLLFPQVWLDERHRIDLAIQVVLLCHPRKRKEKVNNSITSCVLQEQTLIRGSFII